MERSIEDIWKKGFLKSNSLVIPKVTDLYNQKSRSIMGKMKTLYKWNIIGLYAFALLMGLMSYAFGLPLWLGILLIALFVAPALYSRREMKSLQPVEQFVNCYDYLVNFNGWLEDRLKKNISIARFYYPTAVLASASIIWFSEKRQKTLDKLLETFPDMPMVFGIPLYFALPVIAFALIMGIFAGRIYRFDVGLIYGRSISRIKELISDLDELREK